MVINVRMIKTMYLIIFNTISVLYSHPLEPFTIPSLRTHTIEDDYTANIRKIKFPVRILTKFYLILSFQSFGCEFVAAFSA